MAILEKEIYLSCKNKILYGLKCLTGLLRMDSGFIKSNKKYFSMWVNEFDNLREIFVLINGISEIKLRLWTFLYSRIFFF